MSTSAVERGLRALSRPDTADGVVELRSCRRTKPGGLGTTAERRVRPLNRQEPFVWVPVVAAEHLEPRQLRAWAALAYAQGRRVNVSEAQLGEVLVHHSGKRAGQAIGAGAASAVVDSLEGLGWLRVHRRQGLQGRHLYEVLELPAPLEGNKEPSEPEESPVDEPVESSCVSDGSAYPADDGSLATKEDLQIDGLVNEGELISSAVGEAEVVTGGAASAKAEPRSSSARARSGLALRADEKSPSASSETETSRRGDYTGPELTFSPRLAWIMEPVAWLVQQARTYVQREFARQLGAQLAEGTEPARLRARLQARFARTSPQSLRSVEGWLLKVAAVRWGCHDPRCEEGIRWHSGEQCEECLAIRLEHHTERQRQRCLEAGTCPDCKTPLAASGRCSTCQPAPTPRTLPAPTTPSARTKRNDLNNLPRRCLDCGTWTENQSTSTRCERCAVQHALREAEIAAMDAASAGLPGPEKLKAAAHACAEVRRSVATARMTAVAAGLDQAGQDAAAVAAAQEMQARLRKETIELGMERDVLKRCMVLWVK